MTFLDLVRVIGEISRNRCGLHCDITVHRREAASTLGILLEHPSLLIGLTVIGLNSSSPVPSSDTTGTQG